MTRTPDGQKLFYKGVVKEWRKVREFFTDGELEELREIS